MITDSWTKKFRNREKTSFCQYPTDSIKISVETCPPPLPWFQLNWARASFSPHGLMQRSERSSGSSSGDTSRNEQAAVHPSLVSFNPQTAASAELSRALSSPEQWTNLLKLCQYGWLAICYPTCVCRGKSCSHFPYSRVSRAHGPPKLPRTPRLAAVRPRSEGQSFQHEVYCNLSVRGARWGLLSIPPSVMWQANQPCAPLIACQQALRSAPAARTDGGDGRAPGRGGMPCSALSRVSASETPWATASQAPLSMGLSRQEHEECLAIPRDPSDQGIQPESLASPASAGRSPP